MKSVNLELIKIKQTKSVEMYYDEEAKEIHLIMIQDGIAAGARIPISKAFQVKRGLESAVQRFYRRNVNKQRSVRKV